MKNERIKMLEEIDTNKAPKEVLRDFIEDYSQIFFKYLKRVNLKNIDSFLKDEKVVNYMEEVQGILTEFLKKNIIERIEGSQNKEYNFILMSMDGFFLDESLIEELEIKRKYELTMENKINQITEFIYNAIK